MTRIFSLLISIVLLAAGAVEASGKNSKLDVVLLGDSNTWLGGDDCTKPKGWNKWFADEFGARSCRSYARSGATWSHTDKTRCHPEQNTGVLDDDNVIYNQIIRLRQAVESGRQPVPGLVVIAAGTNDAWFDTERPGLLARTASDALNIFTTDSVKRTEPSSLTSLAEAVVYDCMMLMEDYPGVKIVILTPLQSTAIPEAKLARVTEVLQDCSAALGVSVIRQDVELPVRRVDEKASKKLTYDGTHTSVEGARRNGHILARIISELISQ